MKYRILTPIRHGGKRYEPPAVVEMPLLAAAPLLAAGAIHLAEGEPMQGWLALDAQGIADLLAPLDLKRPMRAPSKKRAALPKPLPRWLKSPARKPSKSS